MSSPSAPLHPPSLSVASWPFHLFVPAATITVAAGALLTFAAPRTVLGAKLYGGATEHGGTHTVRLACVRRETGIIDGVPLEDVELTVDGETQRVGCDREGQAEIAVRLAGARPASVRIVRGAVTLAAGEVSISSAKVRARSVVRSGMLRRTTSHGVNAAGFVPGGALVLGRATTVFVRAAPTDPRFATLTCPREDGGPSDPAAWAAQAIGADFSGSPRCGPFGWELTVSPTFTTAQLTLAAKSAPGELLWEAQLPVVAGPVVTELRVEGRPAEPRLLKATVRSTRGASQLHARVDDRRGRRVAQTFAMNKAPDGQSFAHLTISLPPGVAEPADEPILVVGSEDSTGDSSWAERLSLPDGAGQTPTRVDPSRDVVLAPSVLWLDGLVPLADTEVARTTRARGAVAFFVAAGALLEVVLVIRWARAATRAFQAHLQATADGADLSNVEDKSWLSGVLVVATLIVFGFGIIGLVVASRG